MKSKCYVFNNYKKIYLLFICLICFSVVLFAGGKKEKDYTIFIQEIVSAGEPIFYKISSKNKIQEASAVLINSEGKIIANSCAFKKGSDKHTFYGFLALSTYANGSYTFKSNVKIEQEELSKEKIIELQPREYEIQVLKLGKENSTLLSTPSPEKQEQSLKLYNTYMNYNPKGFWSKKPFIKPVASNRITSVFGGRRENIYYNGKKTTSVHTGVDFGIPLDTEVLACAKGKVVFAEFRIITGWTVIIEHLPGLYSLYYHLNKIEVSEGKKVKQGECIAKSGSTGFSTGPHLHWEIRGNGVALNPFFFTKDYFPK